MPLGLVLIGGGVMLLWGAFTGDHPWSPVVEAFGGAPLAPPGGAGRVASTVVTPGPSSAPVAQPGSIPNTAAGGWPNVVAAAQTYLGAGYRLGRADHTLCDCSGLTMRAWGEGAGVRLVHNAALQYGQCYAIPRSALVPGALIFMPLGETHLSHVAMYIGGGQTIESAPSHGGVGIVPMGYQPGPYFYGIPRAAGRP